MNFKIRRILVAVADGSAKNVVDRAAELVGTTKAQVELFSVVRTVRPVLGMTGVDDTRVTRAWVDGKRQELEKLAKRLRQHGVAACCNVVAYFSVTDAIVSEKDRINPRLADVEPFFHFAKPNS